MNPNVRSIFPNASKDFYQANDPLRAAEPKSHNALALDKTAKGEKKSVDRVVLRFKGCFVRPRDPDNFAGSLKGIIDGLRHARLIRNDDLWSVKLECEQEKVASFEAERVELEIIYP